MLRKDHAWWFVCLVHFFGYVIVVALEAYYFLLIISEDIPDEGKELKDGESFRQHILTQVFTLLLFLRGVIAMCLDSSEWLNRESVVESFNQGFKLNEVFKNRLIPNAHIPPPQRSQQLVRI